MAANSTFHPTPKSGAASKVGRLAFFPLLALAACEVPNGAPQAKGTIPPLSVPGRTGTVDVSAYFTDPDGDALSYAATSSDPGVATVSVSGGTVTVAAVARGVTDVTVTATDPGGLSATQTFRATVPNRAPVAGDPVPDVEVRAGDTAEVDVSGHFTDPDGDALSYAAASSSPGVATVSVSGGTVAVAAVARGMTDVTVTATDPGGLSATQTFRATVPNRAPVAGDPVPDVEVRAGDTAEVDVSGHFTDPDGDALSYAAASSSPGVATVSVSGGTVAVAAVARGMTDVTVTATDPGGLSATQTFRATVPNRAPVAGDPVPDVEVRAGDTAEVDVSGHFTDPDGDALSYAAASSSPGVATVSVSGGTVAVAAVARGMTDVTVTATDPGGLSATQTFRATVPNRAPVAGDSIPDVEVRAGDTAEVDVSGHFTDPDGDALSYAAASSSPGVATVSVSGGTVAVAAVARGMTDVTVTATDPGGLSATQTFRATVPNRAPVAGDSIPDVEVRAGDTAEVDVSGHFTDPDGDALSYAAASSSPGVATVSVSGGTVAVAAVARGMTDVTVTATDPGGLSATQTFRATVPNRAPVAGDPVPDMEVPAGDTAEVDVSGHFTDPDGDALSYAAASSGPGVATVSVSGGTVAVAAVARGVTDVTVEATDPGGLSATQTFRATVPNRAPEAGDPVPDMEMLAGDTAEVDVSGHFTDPDADALSYAAASSGPGVATVSVSGGTLRVAGVGLGTATLTVTATDPDGLSAQTAFGVTVRSPDRAVLEALYEATGGPDWHSNDGWLTDAPIFEWHGVSADGTGRADSLGLGTNNLVGSIPPELANLTSLTVLDLGFNGLGGSIPPETGNLAALEVLDLRGNNLEGSIPAELGALANLAVLDLGFNDLTGSIPPETGNLAGLEVLDLRGNNLTGPIPPELGGLANLTVLDLGFNGLEGSIPPETGNLAGLEVLDLQGNDLEGSIPPELGGLANLTVLDLGFNDLTVTDSFPGWIANLADLTVLDLGSQGSCSKNSGYTGPVPAWLADLTDLTELDLGCHRLTGSIPPEFGNLANLEELDLALNELTGSIPPALGQLSKLKVLGLAANELSGSIPPKLGQLSKLVYLALWSNDLSGPVSSDLDQLSVLVFLLLDDNELTDEFPASFPSLGSVEKAEWDGNAGLCAPKTEKFEAWLRGMRYGWSGPRCPEAYVSHTPATGVSMSTLIRHLEEQALVAETLARAAAREREDVLEVMKTVETLRSEIELLRNEQGGGRM